MSGKDGRPEAQSFSAAAEEAKDSIVNSAAYVKDRVVAPASGDKSADKDVKSVASDKAEDAKEHSKGVIESISDGAKYVGSRFTASAGGTGDEASRKAENAKNEAGGWFSQAGDKAQEKKDQAGNKLEAEKDKVKDSYNDAQKTIEDKLATTPAEEAKARGEIPSSTAAVSAAKK